MEHLRSRSQGVSTTFAAALQASTDDYDSFISILEKALIWCIEGTTMNGLKVRYSFPIEILNIVVNYHRNQGSLLQSHLWIALNANIKQALNIQTVANNKVTNSVFLCGAIFAIDDNG